MRLTVHDAAVLLRVSRKTVYRWVGEGRLPGYRVGHQFRFDRAELLEWAAANRVAVSPEAVRELPHEPEPVPPFDDALRYGGIAWHVGGATRDEALRAAVDAALRSDEADRSLVFDALRAREELASTAIGGGLAIPHLRNPLALHLPRASVSLCFLDAPVPWNAPDGVPVHTLFVVLASTVRVVLQLHSRTLFATRDPAFLAAVTGRASREELLGEARRLAETFAGAVP